MIGDLQNGVAPSSGIRQSGMCVCALAVRDRGTAAEPCLSLLSAGWTVCPRVCTGQASQHAAVAHKCVMHSRPLDRWHCVCMPSV